jgi:hypothetical protein
MKLFYTLFTLKSTPILGVAEIKPAVFLLLY